MKRATQQKPPRTSIYLNDDDQVALGIIKQHYGISSTAAALRRALIEHAKQIKEPIKQIMPILYDRRGQG